VRCEEWQSCLVISGEKGGIEAEFDNGADEQTLMNARADSGIAIPRLDYWMRLVQRLRRTIMPTVPPRVAPMSSPTNPPVKAQSEGPIE
jgi:hypothetical protein